ncbi:Rad17 cell cycle checkpoint protein-domain-containing protein [Phyllosticta citrichinensis]|uniref:Rad17 cell cycle checkpoint protein-domain-containing protein n=1 Tax=Phyllosticta citrichinensis TaxID=1130410 RepID=A0ABR1XRL5_9PEZI
MRQPRQRAVVLSSSDHEPDEQSPQNSPQSRSKSSSAKSKPKTRSQPPRQKSKTLKPTRTSQSETQNAKPKTIQSFFQNAAAQKRRPKLSPTIEKEQEDGLEDCEDTIQDDSLDEGAPPALKPSGQTSVTARAARKRSRDTSLGFGDGDGTDAPLSGSQKFLKSVSGQRRSTPVQESTPDVNVCHKPWVDRFRPANLDELAVHKKKVADVKLWLTNVFARRERKRLLVLKGAAGTGKTTTLNLLAKEMGFAINEWRNPVGSDFSSSTFVSLAAQFEDFMGRSGKFGSLSFDTEGPTKSISLPQVTSNQLVLIEEFPNTFARSSDALQSFRSAIEQFLSSSVPSLASAFTRSKDDGSAPIPVVMIISETLLSATASAADSFTAYRLLGPSIMNHQGTTVIEFNPVAPTFIAKALKLALTKEAQASKRTTAPGPLVLKRLSDIGDVRSAVSALEFLCLRGDEAGDWSSTIKPRKGKKGAGEIPLTKMEQDSLAMISQRESTLGIFHAVGKVVYNKRDGPSQLPQPPTHLPQHRRPKQSEVDVDALIDELGTNIQTYVAALHENYALSCCGPSEEETLDSLNDCIDVLSDADILCPDRFSVNGATRRSYQGIGTDSLRQDEMSFEIAVRGLLFSLPSPVKRPRIENFTSNRFAGGAQNQMFYPTSSRLWRVQEELEGLLEHTIKIAQEEGLMATKTLTADESTRGLISGPETPVAHPASDRQMNSSVLGVSGSMRREMLLERLPYMAKMLQTNQRQTPASRPKLRQDFEKVTSFSSVGLGPNMQSGADEEDSLDDWAAKLGTNTQSVFPSRGSKPFVAKGAAEAKAQQRQGSRGASATEVSEVGIADLVLVDDDIEDVE